MGKRPNFKITVVINELTNLPQVSGNSWIRWFVKDSPKPEARGKTDKHQVKEHRVNYGSHTISFNHHIRVSTRTSTLKECIIVFEVIWEHKNSTEKINLGKVEVNLSEFANVEIAQPTRFLLKDSKINSTLSLTIVLKQLSGTKNYKVPEPTSRVFGDISSTLNNDIGNGLSDAKTTFGSLSNSTFSVQWHSVVEGDCHPRACINDIFNGGDGLVGVCSVPAENNGLAAKEKSKKQALNMATKTNRDNTFGTEKSLSTGEGREQKTSTNLSELESLNEGKVRPLIMTEEDVRDNLQSWRIGQIAA